MVVLGQLGLDKEESGLVPARVKIELGESVGRHGGQPPHSRPRLLGPRCLRKEKPGVGADLVYFEPIRDGQCLLQQLVGLLQRPELYQQGSEVEARPCDL